jgi:hypothetical protein
MYGLWNGAPLIPWTAIIATRWWQPDLAPAEHAQTEFVPSIDPRLPCLEMGFVSTGTGADIIMYLLAPRTVCDRAQALDEAGLKRQARA